MTPGVRAGLSSGGVAIWVACLAVAGLAPPAAGQGAGEADFTSRDIDRGEESYTLISYKGGRDRRLIEVSDLHGVTVGSAQLSELPVCVEGKFDRVLKEKVFRLMGSDRQFLVADGALIAGLMSGDNLWIGGIAKLMPGGQSSYVAVEIIVTLGGDLEIFNERCARFVRARNWRRLLGLARWIETSGKLVESTTVVDHDLYKSLKSRALRQALRIREKGLAAKDVKGRFEVARMYRDLLGRTGDLKAAEHLRRVLELDPGHEQAAGELEAMGYVVHDGTWMTRAEHAELLENERRERDAARAVATPAGDGDGDGDAVEPERAAPSKLATTGRMRRLLEVDLEARDGNDALLALAAGLPEEDEPVARRIVWLLANAGGDAGPEGLLRGLRSRSPTVRKDVADALAWCGCVPDLAGMIPGESEAEVRSHAVSALGGIRTRESVGALVGLLDIGDIGTRDRIGEALARSTGQSHSAPDAWRRWWEENGESFEFPGATP